MGIEIKNKDILLGLMKWQFHSKLQRLILWFLESFSSIYITEGYREKRHRHDLHGTIPVRAIDARYSVYVKPDMVADKVNKNWIYDPSRPHMKCVLFHVRCPKCGHDNQAPFHKVCDRPASFPYRQCGYDITNHWHFHLQVHSKTKYVGG